MGGLVSIPKYHPTSVTEVYITSWTMAYQLLHAVAPEAGVTVDVLDCC